MTKDASIKRMHLAPLLFQRLADFGVGHAFGIPGDIALPLFKALGDSPLKAIFTTHEPSAGFAADAYARLKGLGVAVTTYGAGALNMVNAVGQAYAEKSPVVIVSAAPDMSVRGPDLLIHHKVKTFETQRRIYEEITVANAVLDDSVDAFRDMTRVLEAVNLEKRPGYLEIPRDRTWMELHSPDVPSEPVLSSDPLTLQEALQEIVNRVGLSQQPVILAGVEIMRLGLRKQLIDLADQYHLPVATSFMGKAVFPEHNPHFIGTYMGAAGDPYARRMVEDSDCLLMLGAWLTDTETGLFTSTIRSEAVIQVLARQVMISHHRYEGIGLAEVLTGLLQSDQIPRRTFQTEWVQKEKPAREKSLIAGVLSTLSGLDDRRYVFITDSGDCLFGSVELNAELILSPGYYASMGFGVPAALGAALAMPDRRPVVLVGDGGFQMTGMEISTLVRYGLHAVVIVLNNGGYRSLGALGADETLCQIHPWDYVKVAQALGARATRVHTLEAFQTALHSACHRRGTTLLEVMLAPNDLSHPLQRLRERLQGLVAGSKR